MAAKGILDYHTFAVADILPEETPVGCSGIVEIVPIWDLKAKEKDMNKVSENTVVAAPAEKIYKMLAEPERAVMFVPGLTRITNVASDKRSWDYEFSWHGFGIKGHAECTAADSPKKYQFKTVSGSNSVWTYQCASDGGNTKLSLEIEYEVPQQQLARFASEAILHKMNQNTAREIVSHLKTLLEA